jgi:hypothetical protein
MINQAMPVLGLLNHYAYLSPMSKFFVYLNLKLIVIPSYLYPKDSLKYTYFAYSCGGHEPHNKSFSALHCYLSV